MYTYNFLQIQNSFMELEVIDQMGHSHYMDYWISDHAKKRMAQRAIILDMVKLALTYGREIYRQGLSFYYVTMDLLPEDQAKQYGHRIDDLVVVCDDNEAVIMTCYRCAKGMSYIKRKPKRLSVYAA